jgi:alkylhydroperoxidase family enzyme
MILTARELDCQFIWNAHPGFARTAGVPDKLVDDLRDKKELTGLSDKESAVINYGPEFFRTHRVSQATFDAAQAWFGTLGLVEVWSN